MNKQISLYNNQNTTLKLSKLQKISLHFNLPTSSIKTLIDSGFTYNFKTLWFYSNVILNDEKIITLIIRFQNNDLIIEILNKNRQTLQRIIANKSNDKNNNIDYCIYSLLLKSEDYINNYNFNIRYYLLANMIPNDGINVDFVYQDLIIKKIHKGFIQTLDMNNNLNNLKLDYMNFDIEDLDFLSLKILEYNEINKKKTFTNFIKNEKEEGL